VLRPVTHQLKDIVANRRRAGCAARLALLRQSISENGLVWTAATAVYVAASAVAERAFALADERRRSRRLPGLNSPEMNRRIWNNWDWSAAGEEWTLSEEWKESVLSRILRPNVPHGSTVLEIGPGAGRWSAELQRRAAALIGIDVSEAAVRQCRRRFAGCANTDFRVGNGSDLAGVADMSVDAVWSFDVFVHVNQAQWRTYAAEIRRVLKPGGVAVLHHGTVGGRAGGWRSDVTAEAAVAILSGAGLTVTDHFRSWRDGDREFRAGYYEDAVTVVRRERRAPTRRTAKAARESGPLVSSENGRGDWIRTSGLSVPNRALYQAEPRPEDL
jgi:SAM-dependent methyltransferase